MEATPFSTDSPEIPVHDKLLSGDELDALGFLDVMLREGPVVLRSRLCRIQAEGLAARRLYLNAVEARQRVMMDNFLPLLNLPPWEEVAPTKAV